MTRVALVALALAACGGKPSATQACKHAMDLRTKELDRQLDQLKYADSMVGFQATLVVKKKELNASRDADVESCVAKVEARDLDTDCLMKAERIDHVLVCFGQLDPDPRGAE